jgi:hypothetical protein
MSAFVGKADKRPDAHSRIYEYTPQQANNYFFLVVVLNETPRRIAILRMRSGVRFMIPAASSSDTFALASSITRRSSAKDQDLPAICEALLSKDKAAERSMFADGFAWGPDEGNCPAVLSIAQRLDSATHVAR